MEAEQAPTPAPEPEAAAEEEAPQVPAEGRRLGRDWPEIDFRQPPVPSLTGTSLTRIKPRVAKTVHVSGPVNVHIDMWRARNGGIDWMLATNALWRAMLREDHEAREAALAAQRQTGLPVAEVKPGPIHRALARELERMEEEAGLEG
jgi:hypothetical protein